MQSIRLPRSYLIGGMVVATLFFGLAVLSVAFPDEEPSLEPTVIFSAFGLAGIYLIAAYFLDRYDISRDRMRFRTFLFLGPLEIQWQQVVSVKYAEILGWFRVESSDGRVARVGTTHVGLTAFARAVLRHVEGDVIPPRTRMALKKVAAGERP